MDVRFCDEFDAGFGWIATEDAFLQRASHAIRTNGRVWITDPVDGDGVESRIRELGEPAAVVQLIQRHNRDGARIAHRLGVPIHRTPFSGVPESPFEVIKIADVPTWREVALWWPGGRVLVCGDAVGSIGYFRAPGERVGVHPLLRLTPPRRLAHVDPVHLLVGHGEGLHGEEATRALREALATARRRMPRALLSGVAAALRRR